MMKLPATLSSPRRNKAPARPAAPFEALEGRRLMAATLVSINAGALGGGNAPSVESSVSADGRFVAFSSDATDLVANDTNGAIRDVFLRDT